MSNTLWRVFQPFTSYTATAQNPFADDFDAAQSPTLPLALDSFSDNSCSSNPLVPPGSGGGGTPLAKNFLTRTLPNASLQQELTPQQQTLQQIHFLADVVMETASEQIGSQVQKAVRSRNEQKRDELRRQLKTLDPALARLKKVFRSPGALQNSANLKMLIAVFDYIKSKPDLRNQFADIVNHLAVELRLNKSEQPFISAQTTSKPATKQITKSNIVNLDRTPLTQFAELDWDSICKLCGYEPRDYQSGWFEALLMRAQHDGDRGILGAATQTGKTFSSFPLAVALAATYYPGKSILLFARELTVLSEIKKDLNRVAPDLRVGIIDADHKDFGSGYDVVLASGMTLGQERHLANINPDNYGVIAADEAVFLYSKTGKRIITHLGFLDAETGSIKHNPERFLFGFSADARAYSFESIFGKKSRLDDFDLAWYVNHNYLHEPVGVRLAYTDMDTDDQWEQVIENGEQLSVPKVDIKYIGQVYRDTKRRFGDGKIVIFCPNIQHAEAIKLYFNLKEGEGHAATYHSHNDPEQNKRTVEDFNAGTGPKILIGVDSLAVGTRLSGAVGVVMVYEGSLRKFGQRIGRILGLHHGEKQRQVVVAEWSRNNHANIKVKKGLLPQLIGISDYPGLNIEYRGIQIKSSSDRKPLNIRFAAKLGPNGIGLDYVPIEIQSSVKFFPTRFTELLTTALTQNFSDSSEDMSNTIGIDATELQNFMSGQLPLDHTTVNRIAAIISSDNPSRCLNAWVDDTLELMDVTFPEQPWSQSGAVSELLRHMRRLSLFASYTDQGTQFSFGLALNEDQTKVLGLILRGEFLDDKGLSKIPLWMDIAKSILTAADELDHELIEDLLTRSFSEISDEAEVRKQKSSLQANETAELPAEKGRPDLELESPEVSTATPAIQYSPSQNAQLTLQIKDSFLRAKTKAKLQNAGIQYIYQLVTKREDEIFPINFSVYERLEVLNLLQDLGLSLNMTLPEEFYSENLIARTNSIFEISVFGLEFSTRTANCLIFAGIQTLGELVTRTETSLLRSKHFGRRSVDEIKEFLAKINLHLGMILDVAGQSIFKIEYSPSQDFHLIERIENSSLSTQIKTQIMNAGIEYLFQLVTISDAEFSAMISDESARHKIINFLFKLNLSLNMKLPQEFNFENLTVKAILLFGISIDDFNLSVRSINCLRNAGVKNLGQLITSTEDSLLATNKFGRKSLNEIIEVLADRNLHLGMTLQDFVPEPHHSLSLETVDQIKNSPNPLSIRSLNVSYRIIDALNLLDVNTIPQLMRKDSAYIQRKLTPKEFSNLEFAVQKLGLYFGSDLSDDEIRDQILKVHERKKNELEKLLMTRVDDLPTTVRVQSRCQIHGIEYVYQLVTKTEADIMKLKGLGNKSLNGIDGIKDVLSKLGLSLGMTLPEDFSISKNNT